MKKIKTLTHNHQLKQNSPPTKRRDPIKQAPQLLNVTSTLPHKNRNFPPTHIPKRYKIEVGESGGTPERDRRGEWRQ